MNRQTGTPGDPLPRCVGVVVAGGAGQRLGKPKGLLDSGDGTFLDRAIAGLRTVGADPIFVGVDEPRGPLTSAATALGARTVQVTGEGEDSLLRAGLELVWRSGSPTGDGMGSGREAPSQVEDSPVIRSRLVAMIWLPVDLPLLHADTLQALLLAAREEAREHGERREEIREPEEGVLPVALVRPTRGGRPGEPVVVLLAGGDAHSPEPWDLPVEGWVQSGVRLREVEVDDPGIHSRIRTMADYRRHFPRVFRRRFQKW